MLASGDVVALLKALLVETRAAAESRVVLDNGEAVVGHVTGLIANPESVLIRPADANAYAQNDLIASSTTAANIVTPSFEASRLPNGSCAIRRLRLYTNITTGFGDTFTVELWSRPPTFTNGDNGAYAVATGTQAFLGSFAFTLTQVADGAYGVAIPATGSEIGLALPGTKVWWSLKYTGSGGVTPASSQQFRLVPEIVQN